LLDIIAVPAANTDLFLGEASPADRWPTLPSDWLVTEPETSLVWIEQAHRQQLEREQRGE
jgi:hypothetical protein